MHSNDGIEWLLIRKFSPSTDKKTSQGDRRNAQLYRMKKQIVKNVWLVAGLFMLANPALPIVLGTALFTAFLSFSILDETK